MNKAQVRPMSTLVPEAVYSTSIGRKIVMAVTGIVFIGFVVGHMIGNLQIFLGQDKINSYAVTLQSLGALLWFIRIFLLSFFIFHIWLGIKLWIENKLARPVAYAQDANVKSTVSSRTMIFSGSALFLFVIYHLLHFTLIVTNPEYADLRDSQGRFDVYSMMILGFSNYALSGVYILAVLFLSFHVNHGVFSLFQTLGLNSSAWIPRLQRLGNLVAAAVFFGYVSIPVAVMLGIIKLPGGTN